MPIYEYECEACTHKFDTLQKFNEAPLSKCPECEKESLRKLISAAAFRLKGQGWYETDFKSGNKKNIAGSSESGSSENNASNSGEKSEQPKSGSKEKSDGKKSGERAALTIKLPRAAVPPRAKPPRVERRAMS